LLQLLKSGFGSKAEIRCGAEKCPLRGEERKSFGLHTYVRLNISATSDGLFRPTIGHFQFKG
jgi:hypothetical protein